MTRKELVENPNDKNKKPTTKKEWLQMANDPTKKEVNYEERCQLLPKPQCNLEFFIEILGGSKTSGYYF